MVTDAADAEARAAATETVVVAPPPGTDVPPPPAAEVPPPPPGAETAPPRAAPVVPAPLLPPAKTRSGWRRALGLAALAVVVAVASGAITYFVRKDDGKTAVSTRGAQDRVARRSTTSSTSTSTTSTSTTSTTLAALTPVSGTVARTCGAGGTGDCFVSIRTAPDGAAPEVGRLLETQGLVVECQVNGESVQSSVLGRSSTVWDRTPAGTFLAAVYVDAPGFDPLRVAVPCP